MQQRSPTYCDKLGTAQLGAPLKVQKVKFFKYAKGHYC